MYYAVMITAIIIPSERRKMILFYKYPVELKILLPINIIENIITNNILYILEPLTAYFEYSKKTCFLSGGMWTALMKLFSNS